MSMLNYTEIVENAALWSGGFYLKIISDLKRAIKDCSQVETVLRRE